MYGSCNQLPVRRVDEKFILWKVYQMFYDQFVLWRSKEHEWKNQRQSLVEFVYYNYSQDTETYKYIGAMEASQTRARRPQGQILNNQF